MHHFPIAARGLSTVQRKVTAEHGYSGSAGREHGNFTSGTEIY